jgi:hypothetical protein
MPYVKMEFQKSEHDALGHEYTTHVPGMPDAISLFPFNEFDGEILFEKCEKDVKVRC